MKLRDKFWLWGQDAGSHHRAGGNARWKLPGINLMEPVEGAQYLGVENMCRVVMRGKPAPPFDQESEKLRAMKNVVWSAIGDSGSTRNNKLTDLDEVLRQAGTHSNITGAILDDFFLEPTDSGPERARASVGEIAEMRHRLHSFPQRPLDFWIVWYKREFGYDISDYLSLFDVVTYWNMMAPAQLSELEADIQTVIEKTPGKRRLAGFYMWNYGEGKPLSIEETRVQCETYHDWIKRGHIEGIVFCSNCCADLDLEAVKWTRDWIREVGDEPMPNLAS